METTAPVTLTPAAGQRMRKLIERSNDKFRGVRLSAPRTGCSGFSYALEYVREPNPEDRVIDGGAVTLFIDRSSLDLLDGLVIDWQEQDFAGGFTFSNPNATGSCGCGDSFTVGQQA